MLAYSRRLEFRSASQVYLINLFSMIMARINVLTDLILLVTPLLIIWSLQMHKAMKLQLTGIFCVGGLYFATPPKMLP